MKKILLILLGIFPLMAWSNNQKRALIIAIGHYKDGTGWRDLSSLDDLTLMKTTLIKQGFSITNILTITDANATKQGIEAKIEELIKSAQPGDKIVIHYSGHGQQVRDYSNDEPDGYDEAIVPYDAPSESRESSYHGEKHILDDEINVWIGKLRAKVGSEGHVLLIMDSCCSGSASRGTGVSRGDKKPIGDSNKPRNILVQSDFVENQKQEVIKGIGKFILFTGAASSQENFQTTLENGQAIGSLTYAFSKAFEEIPKGASYEALFARIRNILQVKAKNQTPTSEGDVRFKVFDGEIVAQEPFFTVRNLINNGKRIIKLTSGQLANVFEGAKFDFLPSGSQNVKSSKPIARGRVVSANSFESTIEIEEGELPENDAAVWGFQTEQAFGKYKVTVKFGNFKDLQLRKSLEDTLKSCKTIIVSDKDPDLEIVQESNYLNLSIASTGDNYTKVGIDKLTKQNLTDRVLDYGRAKFLSSLEMNNSEFQATINLVPAKLTEDANGRWVPEFSGDSTKNAFPVFDTSQQGWFTIKNTGDKTFYFSLLDIQPDGQINVLFPNESNNYRFEDVKIDAGKEKGFPISSFGEPFGIEKFKVIMSSQPESFAFLQTINRQSVLADTSRSRGRGGEEQPIMDILKDMTDGSMSRTTSRTVGTMSAPTLGGTASFTFKIAPAKK